MPCSACGGGSKSGTTRPYYPGMNLGVRGCGSYYYFRRRRVRRGRR